MLKKISIIIFTLIISACSQDFYRTEPKYKISDEDTKKIILISNELEQCIYPEVRKANGDKQKLERIYKKFSKERHQLFEYISFSEILPMVVGIDNAKIITGDQLSLDYFIKQFQKFNNSNPVEPSADMKRRCNGIKQKFENELRKIENQNKKAEKERKQREAYLKTPAGQAELARLQQQQYQQEMINLQRQQINMQRAQMINQIENAKNQQMFNQFQQINNQMQQQTQQFLRSITPQTIIVKPAYQAPCFGTGPCW